MRILRTVLLCILTVILITASVFLTIDGNLARLTGWYRFEKGGLIFRDCQTDLQHVNWMRIADLHDTMEIRMEADGSWWIFKPFCDRMDPNAARRILDFTAQSRLVDTLPYTKELRGNLREFGVEAAPIRITLKERKKGSSDHTVARYTLGSTSPWLADVGDGKSVIPTTYLRTDFYGRDKRIHVVTGNILSLFGEGLDKLRDQSPLRFEPEQVQRLTIQNPKQAPLTLEKLNENWQILSPMNAPADSEKTEAFLRDLSRLQALKITPAESSSLPNIPEEECLKITLYQRGSNRPLTLTVYPPSGNGASAVCQAVASDRPSVFTLKAEANVSLRGAWARVLAEAFRAPVLPQEMWAKIRSGNREITVADIKRTPDDLRSHRFCNLKADDVSRVLLRFKYSTAPLRLLLIPADKVGRMDDHWMVSAAALPFTEADPDRIEMFLKSFSQIPVAGFQVDATDKNEMETALRQYGLTDPHYIVIFALKSCPLRTHVFGYSVPLIKDRSPRTFLFGRATDASGNAAWYGMEEGDSHIYRISPKLTGFFSMSEAVWKSKQLCDFSLSNVKTVTLRYQKAPLCLTYDYLGESWTGTLNGEDVTPRINPNRANYYLKTLQSLQVGNWLDASDETALKALQNPAFSVSLSLEIPDYSQAEGIIMDGHDADIFNEGDSEIDRKMREAAVGQRSIRKKTITIEISPSENKGGKGFFYGRIKETGQLFMLPVDRAIQLDAGVLDT